MRKLLLFFFVMPILIGCTKDQVDDQTGDNVYGNWIVISLNDIVNDSITEKIDVDSRGGMDVKIKFMDDSTFCGQNTSNDIAGHYTMMEGDFNIDVYGGTKVGQPEWGNLFSDVVYSHSFTSYERSNNLLRLYYNNNKKYIELTQLYDEINCSWTYTID